MKSSSSGAQKKGEVNKDFEPIQLNEDEMKMPPKDTLLRMSSTGKSSSQVPTKFKKLDTMHRKNTVKEENKAG